MIQGKSIVPDVSANSGKFRWQRLFMFQREHKKDNPEAY